MHGSGRINEEHKNPKCVESYFYLVDECAVAHVVWKCQSDAH